VQIICKSFLFTFVDRVPGHFYSMQLLQDYYDNKATTTNSSFYSMDSMSVGVHDISHKLAPLGSIHHHSVQAASIFLAPVQRVVCLSIFWVFLFYFCQVSFTEENLLPGHLSIHLLGLPLLFLPSQFYRRELALAACRLSSCI